MKKRNYFLTGLISIFPLAITYFIINWLFIFFSGPGKKIINYFFTDYNSSILICVSLAFSFFTNNINPDVGFGVVGTNI